MMVDRDVVVLFTIDKLTESPQLNLKLPVISDRDAGNRAAGPGRHAFRVRLSIRLLGPGRKGSVWIACHHDGFGFSIYYGGLRLSEASGCQ